MLIHAVLFLFLCASRQQTCVATPSLLGAYTKGGVVGMRIKAHEIESKLKGIGLKREDSIHAIFTVIRKYEHGKDFYAEGVVQYGFQAYLRLRKEKGLSVL